MKVVESPAATIFKYCERSEHINSQLSTFNYQLSAYALNYDLWHIQISITQKRHGYSRVVFLNRIYSMLPDPSKYSCIVRASLFVTPLPSTSARRCPFGVIWFSSLPSNPYFEGLARDCIISKTSEVLTFPSTFESPLMPSPASGAEYT